MNTPEQSALGKPSAYADQYDASLLFPIARAGKRQEIGVGAQAPFFGADMWTAYELSWLNLRGKPQVALVQVVVPCETPNIVEQFKRMAALEAGEGSWRPSRRRTAARRKVT